MEVKLSQPTSNNQTKKKKERGNKVRTSCCSFTQTYTRVVLSKWVEAASFSTTMLLEEGNRLRFSFYRIRFFFTIAFDAPPR